MHKGCLFHSAGGQRRTSLGSVSTFGLYPVAGLSPIWRISPEICRIPTGMSSPFETDAAQVRVYRDYHGIEYPLLIAGTTDKEAAGKAFPLIERVKAYPTTIFLDAEGNVHAVYSGFSGPATGEEHTKLRATFEGWIEELLDRAGSAP